MELVSSSSPVRERSFPNRKQRRFFTVLPRFLTHYSVHRTRETATTSRVLAITSAPCFFHRRSVDFKKVLYAFLRRPLDAFPFRDGPLRNR